jgi:hypothetical protein
MQGGRFSFAQFVRLIRGITAKGEHAMPNRLVADRVIVAVAAYLHPDYCIGDRDGQVARVEGGAAISTVAAADLATWLWSKHVVLAGGIEHAVLAVIDTKAA